MVWSIFLMKPKMPSEQRQEGLIYNDLLEQLNPAVPLLLLDQKIPWEIFETEFAPLYTDRCRRAKPICLMVGLL